MGLKVKTLPSSLFGLLMLLNQQGKTGVLVTVLAGVADLGYQGEVGLLYHNGARGVVWNTGDPLGIC